MPACDDGGVLSGFTVPVFYDSMIAKLVAWGGSRPDAIARMTRALEEYEVLGIRTSLDDLERLVENNLPGRLRTIRGLHVRNNGISPRGYWIPKRPGPVPKGDE